MRCIHRCSGRPHRVTSARRGSGRRAVTCMTPCAAAPGGSVLPRARAALSRYAGSALRSSIAAGQCRRLQPCGVIAGAGKVWPSQVTIRSAAACQPASSIMSCAMPGKISLRSRRCRRFGGPVPGGVRVSFAPPSTSCGFTRYSGGTTAAASPPRWRSATSGIVFVTYISHPCMTALRPFGPAAAWRLGAS